MYIDCLRYVYMPLLRAELSWFIKEHNSHRIRRQKDRKTPQGVPKNLYAFPKLYGMSQFYACAMSLYCNNVKNILTACMLL